MTLIPIRRALVYLIFEYLLSTYYDLLCVFFFLIEIKLTYNIVFT